MTVNKVILVGNLGRDPEVRTTQSGMTIANLSLATAERQKGADGEWADHTEWHRVVVFGRTAENVAKFCQKGKQLFVEGKLRTRKWTDKDGAEKYSTEIVADVVHFLGGGKGDGEERGGSTAKQAPKPAGGKPSGGKHTKREASATDYGGGDDGSDLPF